MHLTPSAVPNAAAREYFRLAMHTLILTVFTIGVVLLFVLVINKFGQVLATLKSKEQYWNELLSS